jgi:hypothetical protein
MSNIVIKCPCGTEIKLPSIVDSGCLRCPLCSKALRVERPRDDDFTLSEQRLMWWKAQLEGFRCAATCDNPLISKEYQTLISVAAGKVSEFRSWLQMVYGYNDRAEEKAG